MTVGFLNRPLEYFRSSDPRIILEVFVAFLLLMLVLRWRKEEMRNRDKRARVADATNRLPCETTITPGPEIAKPHAIQSDNGPIPEASIGVHSSKRKRSLMPQRRESERECSPTTYTTYTDRRLMGRGPPTQFVPGRPAFADLSGDRELPVPEKVPCKLVVTIDGIDSKPEGGGIVNGSETLVHHRIFHINWQKAASFKRCVKAVERFLDERAGEGYRHYRNSWQYRIVKQVCSNDSDSWVARKSRARLRTKTQNYCHEVGDEIEVYAESIENEGGWEEQLPHNLGGLLHSDRDAILSLELNLSYTRYSPHPTRSCDGKGCTAEIRDTLDSRRVKLVDKRVNQYREIWFVPGNFVNNYFSQDLIQHLVEHDQMLKADPYWRKEDEKKFITDIFNSCIRLLASSILANLDLRCLYHLMRAKKSDVDIPLDPRDWVLMPQGIGSLDFDTFIRYQGSFKAHMFQDPFSAQAHATAGIPSRAFREHEVIDPGVVVPLTDLENIGNGGNAEVSRVRIHGDHHKFSPDRGKWFALKRIVRSSIVTDIRHESRILEKLGRVPHDHLTPLLTSWSQGDCCSILLPLADDNLHDLLRKAPWPVLEGSFVIWLLQQMAGLAAALDHIHNLGPADLGPTNEVIDRNGNRSHSGYHHDLHPRNILVFDNVLKIGDFGTARLHQDIGSGPTNNVSHQTRRVQCHPDYEAPDYTLTKKASRPHDVWALGCIFLEMLIWASGKGGEVENFYDERLNANETKNQQVRDASFWYERGGQCHLKSVVEKMIASLKQQHRNYYVFRTLIKLVEGMMRIETDYRELNSRLQIAFVRSSLEKLISQAELDLRESPDFFIKQRTGRGSQTTYAPPSSTLGGAGNTPSELGAFDDSRDTGDVLLQVPVTPPPRRHSTGNLKLPKRTILTSCTPAEPDHQSDLAQAGGHLQGYNVPGDGTFVPDTPTIVMSNHDGEIQ